MRNGLFKRVLAVALSVVVAATGVASAAQYISLAQPAKDSVLPLYPYNLSSVGGISAEVVKNNSLFNAQYNDTAQFSSTELKNGIIANLDKLVPNISGENLMATPFKEGQVASGSSVITINPSVNSALTGEIGMEISPILGLYEHTGNLALSQAFGCIKYARRNSISGADGIMFYLKTDGANVISIEIDPRNPENAARWSNSWDPFLMLKLGAEYSYMPVGGTAWQTATAVQRDDSNFFGAMKFDAAFEGYVKIPFGSLVNDCGFVLDSKQDSFENIYIRAKGIGGQYGNIKAGPFFSVNDSYSNTISVNAAEYPEAPVTIGGTVSGFEQELKDIEAVLLYVKTNTANRISITADVKDDYIAQMPQLQMTAGSKAYLLDLNGNAWSETEIVSTATVPAVELNGAFEGYIKVPLAAFEETDPSVAILKKANKITKINIGLAGIGGAFGSVLATPFLLTDDTGAVDFEISSSFVKPNHESAVVVPISTAALLQPNWETVKHTEVSPLDFTAAIGTQMDSVSASGYEAPNMNASQAFAVFSINKEIAGSEGLVVYVKAKAGNAFMPFIEMNSPADTSRWNYSWNPFMMFAVGTQYEYLTLGSDEWKKGTTVEGVQGNSYFGTVSFAEDFEGYIKIPYSSLVNDSGFNLSVSEDSIKNIYYRLKGIGGAYGTSIVGPNFFLQKDSSYGFKLNIVPNQVLPLGGGTQIENNWETANISSLETVANLTTEKGVKASINTNYLSKYQFTGTNLAASQAYAALRYDSKNSLSGSSALMFYLKTDCSGKILLDAWVINPEDTSRWNMGYQAIMMLKPGASYSYKALNDNKWSVATAVQGHSGTSATHGAMNFAGAFEGFVKIPYTSLINDSGFVFNPELDAFDKLYVRAEGLGQEYGELVAGPFFKVVNDSDSAEIEIYTEKQPVIIPDDTAEPLLTRIGNILKYSKSGDRTGYYFMVGDESRLDLGSPVFRTIAHILNNECNMVSVLQAEEGLTAEKWGTTAGANTAEDLIAQIPGSGEGCIVDVSLMLNDKNKTAEEISAYILAGIEKIKAAKPKAVFVYTSPVPTLSDTTNTAIKEVTEKLSAEDILVIDAYSKVFKEYYTQFYKDSVLPNKQGYIHVADYILSKYLGKEFEIVATTDASEIQLPAGATLLDAEIGVKNYVNTKHTAPIMKLNGRFINGFGITGTAISTGTAPFSAANQTRLELTAPITNSSYVAFRISLPAANKLGFSANRLSDDLEIIFMAGQKYQIMPDGETQWSERVSGIGRADGIKTYGAIEFDKAFTGWVRLPLRGFYNAPATDDEINILRFMFSELGGDYGTINVGPFITMADASETVAEIKLPEGATLINTNYSILNYVNTYHNYPKMTLNGQTVKGIGITGTELCTGTAPFSASNQTRIELSQSITGSSYVSFHISLPAANKFGLSANKLSDDSEIIFMAGQKYQVLADGQTAWSDCVSTVGRADGLKTYGAIEFDKAFTGWVRLPLRGFYNTPSMEDNINKLRFMFSELGGEYGTVNVGPFISIVEPPYTANTVWKTSDLPEMVSFTQITGIEKYWEVGTETVPSPIPTLTENKGIWLSANPAVDKQGADYMTSWFWAEPQYNNVPIGDYTHLMFYVKVPSTKENHLSLCMFTDTDFEYKVMAKMPYALLSVDSTEWQHFNAEDVGLHNYGGIILPAGFEGFIKLPVSSLLPATVDSTTKLARVRYSFSYFGSDSESVLIGGAFGVTKDNDPGPAEVVYDSLPEPTTVKKIYVIEQGDIWPDRVMVYWQPLDIAKSYLIEAYSITKTEDGYEYRLVSEKHAFTNSGTIDGLEMGKQYAILVKACDANGNSVAIYEFARVKTIKENPYSFPVLSDDIVYDTLSGDTAPQNTVNIVPIIIAVAGALLGIGAVVVIIVLIKRRKK